MKSGTNVLKKAGLLPVPVNSLKSVFTHVVHRDLYVLKQAVDRILGDELSMRCGDKT